VNTSKIQYKSIIFENIKHISMKIVKKILIALLLILTVLFIAVWYLSSALQPNYSGEIELKKIKSEVTIRFDDVGVPHINAKTQEDAYVALGYVHAQDRLWQMELIRRIAPGRLSEIFGKKLLKTDLFFSGLGIEEAAAKTIEKLDN